MGFTVACNVTNSTDAPRNVKVTVSISNGADWTQTTNFDFQEMAAGQTGKQSPLMGNGH
ncbi:MULTISPECIES: hypothetical protein [unclassified Streptomyces]|uniref:hypothetical protein n=1 Tax=unclassified Streptomyces TaxID=2593676 RepID=UPI001EDBEFA4|nr:MULTISPECIES: hypothetical protein [unclassified Streptomyces]UKL05860.1 hypothetical protein L2I08_24375 [Streptomyces sp. NBU3104]